MSAITLNGRGRPDGLPMTVWFEWGETTAYGNTTPAQDIGDGLDLVPVSANISAEDGKNYHFRIAGNTAQGTIYGDDRTFSTPVPPQAEDMPLDAAVYEPGRDVIFAVRGGYVFKLNATTGAKISQSVYSSPAFSDAFIAYSANTDKLYITAWNTDAEQTTNFRDKFLLKVNPDTFAIENSYSFRVFLSDPDTFQSGGRQMTVNGNHLYGVYKSGASASTNIEIYDYDLLTDTIAQSSSQDMGAQSVRTDVIYDPDTNQVWALNGFFDGATSFDAATFAGGTPPFCTLGGSFVARGFCLAHGNFYFAMADNGGVTAQTVMYRAKDNSGTNHTIDTTIVASTGFNIRYDAVTDRIYYPTLGGNSVVIIDPNTNTVESVKTGFDSPWDVVFTPTKRFAVQLGAKGLKEIV